MNIKYLIGTKTGGANPSKIIAEAMRQNKDDLARALKQMDYGEFLKTAYWFAVSSVVKARAGMRCQICNSPRGIQAHHRTYETHGYEHLNLFDVVVLCEMCHGVFHGNRTREYVPENVVSVKTIYEQPLPNKVHKHEKVRYARKGIIKPHSEEDLKMPDGDPIVLDRDLIDRCRANGSFTNATLQAFGMTAPLIQGWTERLVGKQMTRDEYFCALKGRFIYKTRLPKRSKLPENQPAAAA